MKLFRGVCSRYYSRDRNAKEDEPFLLSAANNMDPGEFDVDLLALTEVEQMLISRVHVFIELR